MKKIILMAFVLISCAVSGRHNDHTLTDPLKEFREKKSIESLTTEQKDELLILRKEYFSELQDIQEEEKKLRKEANQYMMKNDEEKYEEIHDRMNELKVEKKIIKENYSRKIDEVLEETGRTGR